jgi:hypothetical protein
LVYVFVGKSPFGSVTLLSSIADAVGGDAPDAITTQPINPAVENLVEIVTRVPKFSTIVG